MKVKNILKGVLIFAVSAIGFLPLYASVSDSAPAAAAESKAYENFKKRPGSDFSKLLYLIDYFQSSNLEVYYDGLYYKAPTAALIARFFLASQYKKETVPQWIMHWCNTSIGGQLIYVRYPDGKFRLSRDVLMEEWKRLENLISHEPIQESDKKTDPPQT